MAKDPTPTLLWVVWVDILTVCILVHGIFGTIELVVIGAIATAVRAVPPLSRLEPK